MLWITLRLLAVMLLGFAWMLFRAHCVLDWHLPAVYWGKDQQVKGIIASPPHIIQPHVARFLVDVPPAYLPGQHSSAAPIRLQLSSYTYYTPMRVGDAWQLLVRLKPLHRLASPGARDTTKWAFYHHVQAKGYVRKSQYNHKLPSLEQPVWYRAHPIDRYRLTLAESLHRVLGDHQPFLGIITALTVGFQSSITKEQWKILRATGTSHLVAISGLHIGLVAGFFLLLTQFLWRRLPTLTQRLPASFPASLVGLGAAIIYAGLAGFSVSTQRAVIMIAVAVVLHCTYRQKPLWDSLGLALLIVLLINPIGTLSAGFWLSFGAVALIFYSLKTSEGGRCTRRLWRLQQWGRVQLFVSLGLTPLSLFYFHQTSLIAILANLIAIPWMSSITIPLCLLSGILVVSLPSLGRLLLPWVAYSIQPLWWLLKQLSRCPGGVWHYTILETGVLIMLVISSLILLAKPLKKWRLAGVVGWLALMFYPKPSPSFGGIWLSLLDVGQGLSAVVRTQHHTLLFDAGPRFGEGFDAGEAIIYPFLSVQHLTHLDTVIISHGDNDHIGGLWSLLHNPTITIKKILSSVPNRFPHSRASACRAGQQWTWDGVTFTVISPTDMMGKTAKKHSGNNRSCVLRVTSGTHSLLLTGDIERPTEQALVKRLGHSLASEILIAPHHGSRSSSSASFIKAVHPRYVLFSTGFLNRFHFPKKAIVKRYKYICGPILLLNTAYCGTISIELNLNKNPVVNSYREQDRHYWDKT